MQLCKAVINNIWVTPSADLAINAMDRIQEFRDEVDKLTQQNLEDNQSEMHRTYDQMYDSIYEDLTNQYYYFWNDPLEEVIRSKMMKYIKSAEFAEKLIQDPSLEVDSWEQSGDEIKMIFLGYSNNREPVLNAVRNNCDRYFDENIDQWLDEIISNYGEISSIFVSINYRTKLIKSVIKDIIGINFEILIDVNYL